MSQGFFKLGLQDKEAVYHLFFRKAPFSGRFAIAAGLASVLQMLESYTFSQAHLDYLSGLKGEEGATLFEESFLTYLQRMRLTCDLDAVEEGTVVFPHEPLLRVRGPIIQSQLLESVLLNLINFPTLVATKAARLCLAAEGSSVVEFGLRRAQGADGALTASRAAYLGGCVATSNVLAAHLYGIPLSGTHAHSWVMVFEEELEAFLAYGKAMGRGVVLLVDTYRTLEGVQKAIEAGRQLRAVGHDLVGVRLDSGDLAYLSAQARKMLDAAGFDKTKIVASNQLDEMIIYDLKHQRACVDVWGVGTSLVTGGAEGALDGVYKLSAVRDPGGPWRYCLKISEQLQKVSTPGILGVRRYHAGEYFSADVIYDEGTDLSQGCWGVDPFDATRRRHFTSNLPYEELLVPIIRGGNRVYQQPSLGGSRHRVQHQLASLHPSIKRFVNPHEYPVGLEASLHEEKMVLMRDIRR